jgi:S1-C subfamily serine protease
MSLTKSGVPGEQMVLEAEERRQKGDEKGAAEIASQAAALLKQAEEGRAEVEKQLNSEKNPVGTSRQSSFSFNANRHLLGVTVRPLNAQLASYFGVAGGSGVLVTEVKPGGLVERAGIRAGDCITTLNGAKVSSIQDLTRQIGAVSRSSSSAEVAFGVVRDRTETTVKTNLASR